MDGGGGEGRAPETNPADDFVAELARHHPPRPRPLPVHYRPMASVIVGDRPVHVSTSIASRRALASVGKYAATTGDTIHLATDRPAPEVMAHELTHVAHPSPAPRFFDDDRHSPEERRAEQVAAVMRRAPILRTSSTGAGSPGVPDAALSPGSLSAASLAASIGAGSAASTISRRETSRPAARPLPGGHRFPATPSQAPPAHPLVGGHRVPAAPPPNASTSSVVAPVAPDPPTTTDVLSQFDRIFELLEDRIITELERRSGRFRGGF